MSWRKPWEHVPELRHFHPDHRMPAWQDAMKHAQVWREPLVVLAFIGALIASLFLRAGLTYMGIPEGVAIIAGPVICMLLIVLTIGPTTNRAARRDLQRELRALHAEQRLPCCFQCGYDLRGCAETTDQCPECGNADIFGDATLAETNDRS